MKLDGINLPVLFLSRDTFESKKGTPFTTMTYVLGDESYKSFVDKALYDALGKVKSRDEVVVRFEIRPLRGQYGSSPQVSPVGLAG